MRVGNLPDNGQAQSTARNAAAERAVEPVEDALALLHRDARTTVGHDLGGMTRELLLGAAIPVLYAH